MFSSVAGALMPTVLILSRSAVSPDSIIKLDLIAAQQFSLDKVGL